LGAGVGSLIGKAARGAGAVIRTADQAMNVSAALANKGVNIGANLARASNIGQKTLTSASLSYVEGKMSAAAVYKNTMDYQIAQGASPEQAKARAKQAADATVSMNTIVGTMLNYGAVAPFFSKKGKFIDALGDDATSAMKKAADIGGDAGIKQADNIMFQGKTG
jgi:hypothetical protein